MWCVVPSPSFHSARDDTDKNCGEQHLYQRITLSTCEYTNTHGRFVVDKRIA